MFNIHDGDDKGNYLHDGHVHGKNKNDYHTHTVNENSNSHVMNTNTGAAASTSTTSDLLLHGGVNFGVGVGMGDDFVLRNTFRKRPRRLPPLIEELVGTIDGEFISGVSSNARAQQHQQGGRRGKLLRREKKEENDGDNENDRLGEITKRAVRDFVSPGEDSVAMVAAAAAAAVWSEAEEKGNSLRMGRVNGEWEEALRWISSWGQSLSSTSTTTNTDTMGATSHHDIKNNDMQSGGAGGKQRRRRDSSDRQKLPSERFSAENEIDFERFLDVCIDRCIGDDRDDRGRALYEGGVVDKVTNYYLDFRNTAVGLNQILSPFRSIVQKIRLTTRGMIRSRTYEQTLRSIFGFMLSTTIVWLIRNVNDWRKINKYTNSLRSLLEEERKEANMNMTEGSSNNSKHRNVATKKSGSKKSRRKRRDNRNCKKERQSEARVSMDDDNESEASEDSFERRYIEEEFHRKNSEDQASKECNTTVSSYTTDGVTDKSEFEYQLMSTDDAITKLRAGNKNTWKANNQSLSQKQRDAKTGTSQKENHLIPKSQTSPTTMEKYQSRPNHNLPVVPTAEQREEAARKLREFQQAQIQKIINSKQRQMAHAASTNTKANYAANHITLRDLAQMNIPQSDRNHNNDRLRMVPPPPGLTRVAAVGDEEQNQETDPGYLLSHLLEGDDDDDDEEQSSYNNASKETSPERYLPNQHDSTRSIALGDLLAGTYSGTSSCNFNSFPSNPWKDESVGGSTAETYIGSPTHSANRNTTTLLNAGNDMQCSTDANICLQVSAVAFSPSMKNDPTADERIW